MPRPAITEAQRKSIVATVRVTPDEMRLLEKRYGPMSRGLRALLDESLGIVDTTRHLHKRGKVTGRTMVNGAEVLTYGCTYPGCDAALR